MTILLFCLCKWAILLYSVVSLSCSFWPQLFPARSLLSYTEILKFMHVMWIWRKRVIARVRLGDVFSILKGGWLLGNGQLKVRWVRLYEDDFFSTKYLWHGEVAWFGPLDYWEIGVKKGAGPRVGGACVKEENCDIFFCWCSDIYFVQHMSPVTFIASDYSDHFFHLK